MVAHLDPWPPSVEQLDDDLGKVVTVGAGNTPRGGATIGALVAVAARLSGDPNLPAMRLVSDAIGDSIPRLGSPKLVKAAALLFGIDPDTANEPTVTARRERAAEVFGRSVETFQANYERTIRRDIAEDLLKRLPADTSPEPPSSAPVEMRPAHITLTRRKATLAGLLALLVLAALGLVIHPWGGWTPPSQTEMARLTAEAERPLSLSQTPLPGTVSPILGFGDEIGGRRIYQYVSTTPVTGYYPVLDSFIDAPEHVGDERMFVRVETGSRWLAHRPHWTKPAAIARRNNLIFVYLYVANDAPQEQNCNDLVGPTIAKNVRIRLVVWNSSDNHMHVIRGWISADNAYPKWITDAAAVITTKAAPLTFDPEDSWQYSISPSQFAKEAPLPNQDFFDAGGMELSSHGLLGSCWANRWAMVFAFHQ